MYNELIENNKKPEWNAIFLSVFVNVVLVNGLKRIIKNSAINNCVIFDTKVI
tara:strand:- start:223 stop:378 length:156 start_codon:yes stop_codon:yes gene_type:complete